jgi:hypothetical protein
VGQFSIGDPGSVLHRRQHQSAQNKNRDQAAAKLKTYDSMTEKQRRDLQHNQASLDQEMADSDSFEAAFQSACIATDDPRLKEK